ncbi:hypothetical protein JL09_g843 [Pichia kudriavzevii]|nr:hypothetical protein JL09_g843 [Pichia kudriavzevii]
MNKNMEDLITKWTNQLSLSSKTFESYSEKINEWDRTLVKSSDAVSKLYNDTIQCEQKQEKIDQTLAYIEKQQDELDRLLTSYEKQSDKLLASIEKSAAVPGNSLSNINNKETNDESREKAYKLAEMLESRLDSLGANFSSLVGEVNEVSDNFNKSLLSSEAPEDGEQTLNDILKLLNNHMESLNWISENEKNLKAKLEKLSLSK